MHPPLVQRCLCIYVLDGLDHCARVHCWRQAALLCTLHSAVACKAAYMHQKDSQVCLFRASTLTMWRCQKGNRVICTSFCCIMISSQIPRGVALHAHSACLLQSRLRRTSTADEQPSIGRATRASRLRGASESSSDNSVEPSPLANDSNGSSEPGEDAEEDSDASEPLLLAGEGVL